MSRFVNNTQTLLNKDFKDATRNMNMGVLLIIPIMMAVVFRFLSSIDLGDMYVLIISTAMALTMVPLSYLPSIIAEEKEKNTLRTLILAGVSPSEFIISKVLVSLALMLGVCGICFIVSGFDIKYLFIYLLFMLIGSISLLMLGAVIGIGCKDQMSTGIVSVPVMLLFLFPTTLKAISPVFEKIAYVTPVDHTLELFTRYAFGEGLMTKDNLTSIVVIASWTIVSTIVYVLMYKSRRFD